MCGLAGLLAFNKQGVWPADVDIFIDLLKVSTVRGTDGTGVFFVGDEGTGYHYKGQPAVGYIKQGVNACEFVEGQPFNKRLPDVNKAKFIVGHCRWATRGAKSTINSHPFQEGPITMVHNGTVDIDMKGDHKQKFEVDSNALCYQLSKKPATDVFRDLEGPAAVIWYDTRDNKLRIYRNYMRPLWFAHASTNKMFIASEKWMLQGILDRHHIQNVTPYEFESRKIYEFDHESNDHNLVDVPYKPYGMPPVSNRGRSVHSDYGYGGSGWQEDAQTELANIQRQARLALNDPKPTNVVLLPRYRKKDSSKPQDLLRKTADKFHNMVKGGDADLYPVGEYFGLRLGDRVIYSPENMEFLDNSEKRAIIGGEFKEVLPLRKLSYALLQGIRILGKTRKNPKVLPKKLYPESYLAGVIESITINKDDSTDVRINCVNIEPFSPFQYQNLEKVRQITDMKGAH